MELFPTTYQSPGSAPGALSKPDPLNDFEITLIDFSPTTFFQKKGISALECKQYLGNENATWVHIQGAPSDQTLKELGEVFGLHVLNLEDISNDVQRPKLDVIEQQAFLILSLPIVDQGEIVVRQLSLFLSERFVISICKGDINPFGLIVDRIQKGNGRMRRRKSDYLFYALIDCAIDHGFPVLESFADKIDAIENELIVNPDEALLKSIHSTRREILLLRRRLWPHRDALNDVLNEIDTDLISSETRVYLKSCYENANSVMDLLETYREMAVGMLEVYISSSSQRINMTMRLLTIITTLFIPPTFIVGVYGMNFKPEAGPFSMPELYSPYGYLTVWALIATSFVSLIWFFKRRHWLK